MCVVWVKRLFSLSLLSRSSFLSLSLASSLARSLSSLDRLSTESIRQSAVINSNMSEGEESTYIDNTCTAVRGLCHPFRRWRSRICLILATSSRFHQFASSAHSPAVTSANSFEQIEFYRIYSQVKWAHFRIWKARSLSSLQHVSIIFYHSIPWVS